MYLLLVFIILIIFFTTRIYKINNNNNIEYFSTQNLEILVQADDSVEVFYNNVKYGGTTKYDEHSIFSIPNVRDGDKLIFKVNNTYGPGGFGFRILYDGNYIYSNINNLTLVSHPPNNTYSLYPLSYDYTNNLWKSALHNELKNNYIWVRTPSTTENLVGLFTFSFTIPASKQPRCTNPLSYNFNSNTCVDILNCDNTIDRRLYYKDNTLCSENINYNDINRFILLNSKIVYFLNSINNIRNITPNTNLYIQSVINTNNHQNYKVLITQYINLLVKLVKILTNYAIYNNYKLDINYLTSDGFIVPASPQFTLLLTNMFNTQTDTYDTTIKTIKNDNILLNAIYEKVVYLNHIIKNI